MEPFFILLVVVLGGIIAILIHTNRRATAKIAEVEGQRNEAHRRIKRIKRSSHLSRMDLQEKVAEYRRVGVQVERQARREVAGAHAALSSEVGKRVAAEEQRATLQAQNAVLQSQREAAVRSLAEAFQPDRIRCTKLPIYSRADAEVWSEKKSVELGAEMVPYKCYVCPRYIVTGEHIYHIANQDPNRRSLTRRRGIVPLSTAYDTPIEVTPAVIAQLRKKHGR